MLEVAAMTTSAHAVGGRNPVGGSQDAALCKKVVCDDAVARERDNLLCQSLIGDRVDAYPTARGMLHKQSKLTVTENDNEINDEKR